MSMDFSIFKRNSDLIYKSTCINMNDAIIQCIGNTDSNAMTYSNLSHLKLIDVDFSKKRLSHSSFVGGKFQRCNFSRIELANCDMTNAEFINCKFNNCILNHVDMTYTRFWNCSFERSTLLGSDVEYTEFNECSIRKLMLHGGSMGLLIFRSDGANMVKHNIVKPWNLSYKGPKAAEMLDRYENGRDNI